MNSPAPSSGEVPRLELSGLSGLVPKATRWFTSAVNKKLMLVAAVVLMAGGILGYALLSDDGGKAAAGDATSAAAPPRGGGSGAGGVGAGATAAGVSKTGPRDAGAWSRLSAQFGDSRTNLSKKVTSDLAEVLDESLELADMGAKMGGA